MPTIVDIFNIYELDDCCHFNIYERDKYTQMSLIFILFINVKMSTIADILTFMSKMIVAILTFMSRINTLE